ncbi:MAG: hypothetical protein K2N32_03025 [Clostridia bacterium]|nr:hypothetical protein [Clostridia bacterium]
MANGNLMLPSPGSQNGRNRRRGRTYIPKGSKVDKTLSTSSVTVYRTPKGKTFEQLTPHGKFIRNKMELSSGSNVFTGEVLNDYQMGKRAGYNQALGEQSKFFNGKKKRRRSK